MAFAIYPLSFSLVTFVAAFSARAEDWPEFRGPTGQGLSTTTNLPIKWSADPKVGDKNIRWRQTIPGQGWSSPVVADGRVYVTTAVADDGGQKLSLRALALNAKSGEILWNAEVFSHDRAKVPGVHGKNSQASPTPVVQGDRFYVHFGHLGTACLDLAGKIIWRNTSLKYSPVHGNGGSPTLADNALVFSCEGASDPFVVALHKSDGTILWKVPRESDAEKKFSFSTPLPIEVNGRRQIVSAGSNVVCANDPKTGTEIWRVTYDGYSVVPRPVHGHGLVFISTAFDHPVVMAIRPDGKGDVTQTHVVWSIKKGAPNTPSLLLVGDELYMVSDGGIASCLDARTGKVHWQERVVGNYSASPVFAEGRIYLQNEEGVGVVLKAGITFEKLASSPLGEPTLASLAVADGALFIRGKSHLFRIEDVSK